MTKEQRLRYEYYKYYRPDFPTDKRTREVVDMALSIKEETDAIYKAMDKYAEQKAIAFGLWLTEGNWVKSESIPGSWYSDVDGKEYKRITTNQLYDIFIEQQTK